MSGVETTEFIATDVDVKMEVEYEEREPVLTADWNLEPNLELECKLEGGGGIHEKIHGNSNHTLLSVHENYSLIIPAGIKEEADDPEECNQDPLADLKTETNTIENIYKCDICLESFNLNSSLKRHKLCHMGELLYPCDLCGMTFTTSTNLNVHAVIHAAEKQGSKRKTGTIDKSWISKCSARLGKSTTDGIISEALTKRYKCETCGSGFTQANGLLKHRQRQTGIKPYKCNECEKGFCSFVELKKHIIRIHTEEKPFKCDICGKRFPFNDGLKKHKCSDTGDKPYECDICGKRYTGNQRLKIHKRSHTGEPEKPHKLVISGKGFRVVDLGN